MHVCLRHSLSDTGRRHPLLCPLSWPTFMPVGSIDTLLPVIILQGIVSRSPCFEKDQTA